MSRSRRWTILAAAALCAAAAWGAEVQDTVLSSYKAFLEGRLDDAVSGFRYLATLGISAPNPDVNLAVLDRDKGDRDAELAQWVKASLETSADGFVWNQRGWAYLSAQRTRDARESFLKAVDRSSTTAEQSEADLGLGLTALQADNPRAGLEPLRSALVQGPFMLSAAYFAMAQVQLAAKDKQAALAYLRQSLDLDGLNFEALRALARLYAKIGQNREAWRAYHRILSLDPKDEEAVKKLKKLSDYISGEPQDSMPVRRIARPMLDAQLTPDVAPSKSAMTIRVGLFSGPDGAPSTATRLYFMTNSDFKIVAQSGEVVKEDGRAFDQWEISFRPETDLVELRDASRDLQFTTKQRFRIVPQGRLGSTLLKSVEFVRAEGFDLGDRELRGEVEVQPTPHGFKLVNELRVEDYLIGAVSSALPDRSPLEAYKAEAVVARSMALWAKAEGPKSLDGADICDSARCLRYVGVTEELLEAAKAVRDTEGLVLASGARVARLAQHEDCGGITESGAASGDPALRDLVSVSDSPTPLVPPRTPAQLERWLHEAPPAGAYCEAGGLAQTHSRWVRILDAKDLTRRANRLKDIGYIERIRAARRSATGRVEALEVDGRRGSLTLEGADDISGFLSPGSLRSTLFTITPLMDGRKADRFILWGAGTGSGLGMCEHGAVGQASLGRSFKQILSVYFPGLRLRDAYHPPRPRVARRPGRYPRTLNPRKFKPKAASAKK